MLQGQTAKCMYWHSFVTSTSLLELLVREIGDKAKLTATLFK